jgi:hypothetical protein
MDVTDEYGLVRENNFITVFIPANSRAFVFRVKSRFNKGYEVYNYGMLPISSGYSFTSYDTASPTASADGTIPGRAYTANGLQFPLDDAWDENDMWYLPETYRERIFHVIQYVTPAFLRMDVQIPINTNQGKFQREEVSIGINKDFGFTRGRLETVHLNRIHYGYRYGNDTNFEVYTTVRFVYGEYEIEIPRDAELIFQILNHKVPSHWITLPISTLDSNVENSMRISYGILGFPVYGLHQRERALSEYNALLKEVKLP